MDDRCAECGYDGSALTPAEVATGLQGALGRIRAVVATADPAVLAVRPDPQVWSVTEYVGHLKDALGFHRWLVERALAEDGPVVAVPDPDAAVAAAGYAQGSLPELLDQVGRRVDRLGALLAGLDSGALRRPLRLDRDLDVAFVARSALHEAHHHAGDVAAVVAQVSG